MVFTLKSVDEILSVTILIGYFEPHFLVVLSVKLCKVVLTFDSVDKGHRVSVFTHTHYDNAFSQVSKLEACPKVSVFISVFDRFRD